MHRFRRPIAACLLAGLGVATTFAPAAQAQLNGVLGIYFDDRANECSQTFGMGQSRTLYVLLLPEGDTRGGISGVEFSIDASGAPGYSFSNEQRLLSEPSMNLGNSAVGSGLNVVKMDGCESRIPIPIWRLQVTNVSGGRDAFIEIAAKSPPGNPTFPCPLVTLCNYPVFTTVCVAPDRAVFNPSGALRCGIASEKSDWGRVKELYR